MFVTKKITANNPYHLSLRTGLFLFLFLLSILDATAQKFVVKGKLTDEKGNPIAFASVVIKGKKIATQADALGFFNIKLSGFPAILTCSAMGFETTEKIISQKEIRDSVSTLEIVLKSSPKSLNEVVVVGYASSKKTDLSYSGSIASEKYLSASISGSAPGLSLTPASPSSAGIRRYPKKISSGASSTIRIRGAASISTSTTDLSDKPSAVSTELKKTLPAEKRSSLLTAGEVNDFKKWKMWEDFNAAAFKEHSEHWQLFPTHRFSVQLLNENHKAITGETVYLIDKSSGDTLWTAVSDNTGKAELWNGFNNNTNSNELFITAAHETKSFPAIPFAQGINRIQLNRSCNVSNKVEIAFVVDATGSMTDEIEYLKEELEDILTKATIKDPSLDLNTAAVFYRDNGDAYVTNEQPFTSGILNTISFIKNQAADGGGDYPEALDKALEAAISKLHWTAAARTRIIFLLMDAPPHDDAKNNMQQLISGAAAKGIRIVPIACSGTDKATEFIMRSIALATNGTYLFLTDDSGIGDVHIKPTTDNFKVELLNDLLQRIIEQMCYVNTCEEKTSLPEPLNRYSNTEKVIVYPNPTNGAVTLETKKELKDIFITDFTGKILQRLDVKSSKGKYNINLSQFPSATYFISYVTADGKTGAEKVVLIR